MDELAPAAGHAFSVLHVEDVAGPATAALALSASADLLAHAFAKNAPVLMVREWAAQRA